MTKPESKATPRPWNYDRETATICADDCTPICCLDLAPLLPDIQDKNAALIVAAVNTYDAARELAALALETVTAEGLQHDYRLHDKAREVLKLMGEDSA